MKFNFLFLALIFVLSIAPYHVAKAQADITINDAYAFPTSEGQRTGAAFMTITNHAPAADKLIGAETEAAASSMMHSNVVEGNTVKMIHADSFDIASGDSLKLDPVGHHIMLMGLREPLKAGTKFPLTLVFEKSGKINVEVSVRDAATEGTEKKD